MDLMAGFLIEAGCEDYKEVPKADEGVLK